MSLNWLDRGLFISPIYYCLCISEEQFHKELKRLKVKREDYPPFIKNEWSDASLHHLEWESKRCAIVCIRDTKKRLHVEVCGLLIHEAVHIWREIRESIGEDSPSSEFEAYAIQSIAQRLIHSYNKMSKIKKERR